ncbi:hypothetical protein BSKO_05047 [Bryopsis sp. KO-2023]|nr:hypothetical protein BSKO_05047 [Bryopsis sp. KO-2023]
MLLAPIPFLFLAALVFFHTSELALAVAYARSDVSLKNCLVTKPYCVALAAGLIEYGLEERHLGGWITQVVRISGGAMVVSGELIRKLAMVTAKGNFTHKMVEERRQTHKLVTHGIYSWVRHPGYLGWMLWAIGMQMLLVNPVCTVACICVSWRFFKERIFVEEKLLREFFPGSYEHYSKTVPSGLPFLQ